MTSVADLQHAHCRKPAALIRRSIFLITVSLVFVTAAEFARGQQPSDSDTAESFNADPVNSGDDAQELFDLGALQVDLNELDAAEASYLGGIELLIEDDGEFSPRLLEPYRELARVYVQLGQHLEALTVLEHAQHISQRNFGLFNTDQTIIIDEMSQAYQAAGDTRSAQEIKEETLNIARRRFGEGSLEVVPFHYHLAEYYELSRMREKARDHYEDVVDILEEHLDEYAVELLRPLRELVRIDILTGKRSFARRRLEEMLELDAAFSALERARSLAVLGDWSLATGREEPGLAHYRDAYATLTAADAAAATALFATPALINFVPPAGPVDRAAGISSYEWGSITAVFEISANGRASGVEIVAATPPGLMNARYKRRLAESYFRPRLVAGEPVATMRVRFTHRFRYSPLE